MRHLRRNHAITGVLLLFGLAAPGLAQSGAGESALPPLAVAQRHIQGQHWDSATAILVPLTDREPENARAWALLGFAYHASGELDRAIPAHRRATEFDETAPNAMRNLGLAYALQGDRDAAFEWLERAKATGRSDMTTLDLDPDSESLRDDPRYRALMPTAEDWASPFVEEVDIIHLWNGEAPGDQFGWIARAIGDVDGDGVQDLTASAPTHAQGAGKVYVYSGRTGEEIWSRAGGPEAAFGIGIEGAGDVDGDGVGDVAAGAPGEERVLVLSGLDGTIVRELPAPVEGEWFGRRAAGVGDANGDGYADVAVGAPRSSQAAQGAGRVYLFSGRDGRLIRSWEGSGPGAALGSAVGGGLSGSRVLVVAGEPGVPGQGGGRARVFDAGTGEELFSVIPDDSNIAMGGMFVSVIGDVDADGVDDIWSTDFADRASGPSTGRAYVASGADGRRLLTLSGEGPGNGFGIGSAEAGDLDGDGHDDVVVGAWQHASAAPSGGKVYIYSGRDGALLWSFTGRVPGETLGFDATGMGDVDGDGFGDLLVTSAWSAVKGARTGRMYIVSGRPAAR